MIVNAGAKYIIASYVCNKNPPKPGVAIWLNALLVHIVHGVYFGNQIIG